MLGGGCWGSKCWGTVHWDSGRAQRMTGRRGSASGCFPGDPTSTRSAGQTFQRSSRAGRAHKGGLFPVREAGCPSASATMGPFSASFLAFVGDSSLEGVGERLSMNSPPLRRRLRAAAGLGRKGQQGHSSRAARLGLRRRPPPTAFRAVTSRPRARPPCPCFLPGSVNAHRGFGSQGPGPQPRGAGGGGRAGLDPPSQLVTDGWPPARAV